MSTLATKIEPLIGMYVEGFLDKDQARMKNTGTRQMFSDDTALIPQGDGVIDGRDLELVKKGGYSDNGASIAVIEGKDYTINTTSYTDCSAVQSVNDTARYDVTYNTLSTDFVIDPTAYDYNYVGFDQGLGKTLKNIARDLDEQLNTICNTALETNKNQQQTDPDIMLGYFTDSGTNEFNVDPAKKNEMYNFVTDQYAAMNYDAGLLRVVGNPSHFANTIRPSFAQGTGNSYNTNYQYNKNLPEAEQVTDPFSQFKFYKDSLLANGGLATETSFVVPEGTLALIPSIEERYISGQAKLPARTNTELFVSELPWLPGIEWGWRVHTDCSNGYDIISYQIEARFATITSYVSDLSTDFSRIGKYQVVA